MRKQYSIQVFVFVLVVIIGIVFLQTDLLAQTQTTKKSYNRFIPFTQTVIKTYKLKYIRPTELLEATSVYLIDSSYSEDMISIKINKSDVPTFEKLLKKLDVEKRNIFFKIYLITAFREKSKVNSPIKDANLKKALEELGNLWNFKSYEVGEPSFITISEGSGPEVFLLVSWYNMNIEITNVRVRDETAGNRTIFIETLKLWGTQNFTERNFIETNNKIMKEKGFLVAGISGFDSDKALILVINAEVKPKNEKEVF